MDSMSSWYEQQAILRKSLRAKSKIKEALDLAIFQHEQVHSSTMLGKKEKTLFDEAWRNLPSNYYHIMPTKKNETIAWCMWHTARIEDIVSNLLIAKQETIFDTNWKKRLNISLVDTGNAWTDEEINSFSKAVNIDELIAYSDCVGNQTRTILSTLSYEQLTSKPTGDSLEQIVINGGLTCQKESYWLRDFWGSKTIAGLILLPLTRHYLMHFEDTLVTKKGILENTSYYSD